MKVLIKKKKEKNLLPKNTSDMDVIPYELLYEHRVIKDALNSLPDLKEPDSDLKDYLDKLGDIPEAANSLLENFLVVFAHWENYYEVKLKLAKIIKSIADEQQRKFLKLAVAKDLSKANITEKKDRAYSDEFHLKAIDVCQDANVRVEALETMVNACQRAYKAVSRIIAIRENLP